MSVGWEDVGSNDPMRMLRVEKFVMEQRQHGVIIIEDGLVTLVKNVTDINADIVAEGDLAKVLKELSDAGWRLGGDYKLKIYKNIETDESRMAEYVSESNSSKPEVRMEARRRKT